MVVTSVCCFTSFYCSTLIPILLFYSPRSLRSLSPLKLICVRFRLLSPSPSLSSLSSIPLHLTSPLPLAHSPPLSPLLLPPPPHSRLIIFREFFAPYQKQLLLQPQGLLVVVCRVVVVVWRSGDDELGACVLEHFLECEQVTANE
jgi:hypothetical protein